MSRKIIYCLFVLALASTANAAPFVFGTWENDSNNGFIDWGTSATITAPKYTYGATGATNGSSALKMDTGAAGWQQNLAIRSYQNTLAGWPNGVVKGFLDNQYLAIDVTYVTADWVKTGSNYATIELNIQGTGLSWTGLGRPDVDTGNPGYAGGWDADNFGAIHTRTMYWDIAQYSDGNFDNGETTALPDNGYVNAIFQTSMGGFSDGGVFYFDNFRFVNVPEPMTIALLGLGGLVLRRRK